MKQKTSTQAILALMQDAQSFKRVYNWRKTSVMFFSEYMEAEYRISDCIRAIPENNADEWRMYADDGEIVLIFTYYYEEEAL